MKMNKFLNDLTLTKRLEYQIISDIKNKSLKPHDLYLSEKQIMEDYAASRTSVRQAISNLVELGQLYRVNGKGTFIAPGSKHMPILIVSHSGLVSMSNANFGEMSFCNGISDALSEYNNSYIPIKIKPHVFIEHCDDIELIYKNIQGVIFFSDVKPLLKTREILERKRIPFVYYGSNINIRKIRDIDYFIYDQKAVIFKTLDYLYERGHRNIAFLYNKTSIVRIQRYKMFKKWLEHKKIDINDDYLIDVDYSKSISRGDKYGSIYNYFKEHPISKDITAVVCVDDLLARNFINSCYRLNYKIPQDFSVMGISDYPFCVDLIIPLTSLRIPFYGDGRRCIKRFISLMEEEIDNIKIKSKLSISERESTVDLNKN